MSLHSGHAEVYMPVCLVVNDGKVEGGYIDFEGMPWTEWSRDNAYNDEQEWHRDEDAENIALDWLGKVLDQAVKESQ